MPNSKKKNSHSGGKQRQRRQTDKLKGKSSSKSRSKSKESSQPSAAHKAKSATIAATASAAADPLLNQIIAHGRFRIGPQIGAGSFGQVRTGTELATGRSVAIKMAKAGDDQLLVEREIYLKLAGNEGFAALYCTASFASHDVLIMELLSVDLESLFRQSGYRFPLKAVAIAAMQMFERLADLHHIRYIYRDIKPENFMLSQDGQTVKLIDFGLADEFIGHDGGPKEPGRTSELVGTERFMSINAHLGFQQSRRDDLEALGYVFAYFLRSGKLPWFEVQCDNMNEQNKLIGEMKKATSPAKLLEGHPQVFADYIQYTRALQHFQKPDYQLLRRRFADYYSSTFKNENKILDFNL